ncbi:MAG: hypothetical protein K2V38_07350 [Gemmataceae bacterium]|nr:hypothetical protein [Gemmataceae bacterium]
MRFARRVCGAVAAVFDRSSGTGRGQAFGRAVRPSAPLRARLAVESLDGRLAPSDLGLNDPTVVNTSNNNAPVIPAPQSPENAAPRVVNFKAIGGVGTWFTFQGKVLDANPGGLTVTLGGSPVTIRGQKLTTDANGNFEKAFELTNRNDDGGEASAVTVNAAGVQSNEALTLVIW